MIEFDAPPTAGPEPVGLTRRLYYQDSHLRSFQASVVDSRPDGSAALVALDATAFYPGGGGQPSDRGTLGGRPVLDVQEEGGVVWHRVDGTAARGERVEGVVDWPRRFDHMQQHTGQHILSRAFIDVAQAETRSFHLGEAVVTIDVEHSGPSPDLLARVEDRANAIVWEDREVRVHVVGPDAARRFPLRKTPEVSGEIRVVEVDGVDWSACGGTHVRRSGEVGMIAVLGTERYKGGTRVGFACGGRALRRLREASGLLRSLCLEFTSGEEDLPRAVSRLKEDRHRLESKLKPLVAASLDREAEALLQTSPTGAAGPVVAAHFPDRDPSELAVLAARIVERGGIALLVAGPGAAGGDAAPAGARDAASGSGTAKAHFAAPKGTIAVGAIFTDLCRRHGAKGGGRPESAQGAIPADRVSSALEDARRAALAGSDRGSE